ncbi:MAG TPA: sensor histidine kinase [Gemmatimonadaceae bacterium]|nr:sensor histidine kinase [Gemmatimonadaceae bacterium]
MAPRALILLALLSLAAQLEPAYAQSGQPTTRILMLYGHDPTAPGAAGFARELRGALRKEWSQNVELYEEVLDFDRLGKRERWPEFAAYVARKYRGVPIDAVVTESSIALQFATERFGPILPGVPIVYGNAFEPVIDFDALPTNVTGRRIPLPFVETFSLARRLQPDAKRVYLVTGASAMDSVLLAEAVQDLTPVLGDMKLEVLKDWTLTSLLRSLRELPAESFVLLSSFRKDWRGQSFSTGELIPSVARASSVPVYGIARNWVGDGVVGGTAMEFAQDGARTGRLLIRVLRQPRGARLPDREVAHNPTVVDWRQLQRWGMSEKRLPEGTQVLFRTPSAWERHRLAVFIVLAVTVMQTALIATLMIERRRRIRAQRSLQEQAAYEQMLAALRTDAVRHAPDDASQALDHAVARIAQFAGAEWAELRVHAERAEQPAQITRWTREETSVSRSADAGALTAIPVEIPLRADGMLVGTLTLHGVPIEGSASTTSREWLAAAADVLAGALARSNAARALAESRGQTAHIARVATVNQLGAAVSHELRQPLSAMRLNAETGALLLGQEPPDVSEARAVFRDIVKDNARAVEVIEHIRLLLRRDRETSEPVSLNDLCRNVVKLLKGASVSKEVIVDLSLADGLPNVHGDAVQLQQVAMNLALNAIESAATSARERRVVLGTAARDGQVELSVRDTGPGLSTEAQQHLFESFFSTKKSGLGMGLTIVHQIVERHHGTVHAENSPGGGALFRVTLSAARIIPSAEGVDGAGTKSVDLS